nr:integrase, catalytic region, zinc finger, CCHC-type, peptidase aspartic, catalytic [Tanacetum cinerariifolium]
MLKSVNWTVKGVDERIVYEIREKKIHVVYLEKDFIIMSNINNNMQTQTSNILHNAIMEAGSKDRPPMLAPGNYVQWKSRIKRHSDTKPNHELIHYCLTNPPYKLDWKDKEVPISKGSPITRTKRVHETYKNVSQEIRDQLNAEAEAVQIILTRIDNDIYSTVDACPNACETWKAIERLKHGESINVQDLETNLYWEFGKITSQDGELLKSYYSRFYKMMNELIRNQCNSQELKTVSYHKLYDILKQHQHEVYEIRAKKIARVANPLAIVDQQQPVYHPLNHPTHYTQNSSTRSQQAATRNRGNAIVNSPQSIYDQEPSMVVEDDETSKDKENDKLMALISLSFKKIYKPTNNNLRTSSNTSRTTQDNSPRINRSAGYENQRIGNIAGARETVDQELEAHYMYMAQLQEVSSDAADSGPICDDEPLQKVSNDDHYNVFAIKSAHPEQSKPVHDTYPIEHDAQNVIIDSLDMSYNREEIDQNYDDNDLAKERELLASLIKKLKCEIDESKNRNKFLETSNKVLIEKLKGEIKDFKNKNKNKSLESSNNYFKEANNRLSETNNLLYADYKKSEAELARRNSMEYASQMELECAKKEAQIKIYKTREDKELDKVIELEHKVKVLDNIVYKTGQSVQTMNTLNKKCRTSFEKPELLKKAQRANPRLYDIGCYNDNLALMLSPDSDEVIRLEKESRSKLSNLIRPFDYDKLNNLYDLFIPQREKSSEQPKCTVKQSVAKPIRKTVDSESNQKPRNITRKLYERVRKACSWWYPKFTPSGYKWKPKSGQENVNPNVSMPLGIKSKTSNILEHTTSRRSNVSNTPLSSNSFAAHRDFPIHRAATIKRIYYVEGLNHNLFSIGQFCDADLEVAFRKSTCYIRDLKGNGLLTCSRGTDLYLITLQDINCPNLICLMAKATSSQAWLWHRRLSRLNFDTINLLSKNDIVVGLLKLKFVKDHLCSSCELRKAKKKSFHTKITPSSKRRLVQRGLQAQVRIVRTDKGTEFLNQTLHAYFAAEGILHQTSVARTPE